MARPCTIPNADGDLTTPSVVFFDESGVVVGKEAMKAALLEPEMVAQFAKREMGNPAFSRTINGDVYPPEVIQSLILDKLRNDAELKIGPIDEAVITVPAYFNEPRRKATVDAAHMAGFKTVEIINEPTAAAIAYGVQEGFLTAAGESRHRETILVFDLGGGTFDVSIMTIDGKNYTVLATDGNVKLGGIDWDVCVVDFLAEEFKSQHGVDPRHDRGALQRLRQEAEDTKRALSTRDRVTVMFQHDGAAVRLSITRQEFEARSAHLLERTRFTVANLLRQAAMTWNDISRILLVGGIDSDANGVGNARAGFRNFGRSLFGRG